MGLVSSAADICEHLHDFAQWLTDEKFTQMPPLTDKDVFVDQPYLQMQQPLAFGDFNGDNKCMGYGLKTISNIQQGEDILLLKTDMCMTSNQLADSLSGNSADNELYEALN